MADAKRTYGDSCGIARALDIVGERWALLVVRELLPGPKRFTDLRAGLPRVGPGHARRAPARARAGGRRRRGDAARPRRHRRSYELTEWGTELAPVLLALGRWGSRAPDAGSGASARGRRRGRRAGDHVRPRGDGLGGRGLRADSRRPGVHARDRGGPPGGHPRSRPRRGNAGRVDRRPTRPRWPPSCGTATRSSAPSPRVRCASRRRRGRSGLRRGVRAASGGGRSDGPAARRRRRAPRARPRAG